MKIIAAAGITYSQLGQRLFVTATSIVMTTVTKKTVVKKTHPIKKSNECIHICK